VIMISRLVVTCVVAALALVGCGEEKDEGGSSEPEAPGPSEPEAEPDSEPSAEPEGEPESQPAAEPEAEGAPEPPTMEAAEPLAGDLHVTWSLPDLGCDMIELLRNEDGGEYEVAATLTGVAESQHDSAPEPGTEYCYRARCIKGGVASEESNEVCGSP
jgi:hypothetical protein